MEMRKETEMKQKRLMISPNTEVREVIIRRLNVKEATTRLSMAPNNQGGSQHRMQPASQVPTSQVPTSQARAIQAPAEDEGMRMEPETRRQARYNKAKWEAGHRATIQGEVSFPGGVEWREDFPRLEDRAIVNRTNQFLRHEDEEGASADRYVTIVPLEHLDDHAHNNCQVVLIGCSSAAMNVLKSDPLLQNPLLQNQPLQNPIIQDPPLQNPIPQNEIEIRPENNPSPATFPNIDTNEVKGRVQGKSSIRWSTQWFSIRSRWSTNEWSTVGK